MGHAARANALSTDCELPVREQNTRLHASLRALLNLFPDRATYEHWLKARQVSDEQRAHLEQFLPPDLQAKVRL